MKLDKFVVQDGKKLRYGYTTGSTSTAAAKAATVVYFQKEDISTIDIETPMGWDLDLDINSIEVNNNKKDNKAKYKEDKNKNYSKVSVIKDGGDDPDATHGIEIFATIREVEIVEDTGDNFVNEAMTISLRGGFGVGMVTKKGLQVAIGRPAINPVPQKMIFKEVAKVLPKGKKVEVTISIPDGEKVGTKTFNPKLGILGGISVLGTTGIVKPMSEEAYKSSIVIEMKFLLESIEGKNKDTIVITPGNYGKKFLVEEVGMDPKKIVIISNFVGHMLDNIKEMGFKKIILVGHIGKLIKVAGGIFHTHSKISDGRLEIMGANALLAGENAEDVIKIIGANTTEEGLSYMKLDTTNKFIAEKIKMKCEKRMYDEVEVELATFSFDFGELARTDGFDRFVEEYKNNL